MGASGSHFDERQEQLAKQIAEANGTAEKDTADDTGSPDVKISGADKKEELQFKPHHLKAKEKFLELFGKEFTCEEIDPANVHAGFILHTTSTPPVKAMTVMPDGVTLHAPDDDNILKHSLILAVQMHGTDLKIENATPEQMEKIEKIITELHSTGKLLAYDGYPVVMPTFTINDKVVSTIDPAQTAQAEAAPVAPAAAAAKPGAAPAAPAPV